MRSTVINVDSQKFLIMSLDLASAIVILVDQATVTVENRDG